MVENPSANAGDMGSIPNSRRSHMPRGNEACAPQLLGPHTLEPVLCNKGSHHNKKPGCHDWRVAPLHCN